MFPPSWHLNLFFLRRCSSNLQVVDFPFVPVTTILFNFLLLKKNKSMSVIIFFSFFLKFLFLIKLTPGVKTT